MVIRPKFKKFRFLHTALIRLHAKSTFKMSKMGSKAVKLWGGYTVFASHWPQNPPKVLLKSRFKPAAGHLCPAGPSNSPAGPLRVKSVFLDIEKCNFCKGSHQRMSYWPWKSTKQYHWSIGAYGVDGLVFGAGTLAEREKTMTAWRYNYPILRQRFAFFLPLIIVRSLWPSIYKISSRDSRVMTLLTVKYITQNSYANHVEDHLRCVVTVT